MSDDDRTREQQRLQEIQRERERLAREMEKEVQRVRAYIMLGSTAVETHAKRK